MKRWLEFLKERLPLHVLLILSLGLTSSSQALSEFSLSFTTLFIGTGLAFIFFLTMRIMDEVKDYTKDQIAHPERPLPRGLLSLDEARRAIYIGLGLGFFASIIIWTLNFPIAALLFAFSCFYLYLMYKEFFVSAWLEERVILYTLSHQAVLVFLTAALASLVYSRVDNWIDLLRPGLLVLGIFFVYEVARKLDPDANPVLQTYRVRFGVKKTGFLLAFACFLTIFGVIVNSQYLGAAVYHLALGPVLIMLLYPRLIYKKHKAIEALAGLWLLLILWTPFMVHLISL